MAKYNTTIEGHGFIKHSPSPEGQKGVSMSDWSLPAEKRKRWAADNKDRYYARSITDAKKMNNEKARLAFTRKNCRSMKSRQG